MADKHKQIVLNEIKHLIDNIKEYADELDWKNHVTQIELEFITSKIAKLHEKSIILTFLNTFNEDVLFAKTPDLKIPQANTALTNFEENKTTVIEEASEIKQAIIIKEEKTTPIESITEVVVDVIEEKLTEPVLSENEINETNVVLDEPITVIQPEPTLIVENVVTVKSTEVNNKAGLFKLCKIADTKKPPITNLKAAISINQRLQFINNLFKGNVDLMNQSIDELNAVNDITEAELKLNELIKKMDWNVEYELFLSFKELVERRFS